MMWPDYWVLYFRFWTFLSGGFHRHYKLARLIPIWVIGQVPL